ERQRVEDIPIHVRIGLHSGEVVVRSIGSDLHMDYTAVGQTTHLAARMEQAALPGSILVTADTMRLAEGFVTVKSLGPLAIKGLSEGVDAYEVIGAGTARTRFQAAAARGLTRFVGRGDELTALDAGLRRALEGHGLAMGVVGAAGVGKSRLCQEFVERCRSRSLPVVEVHCLSHARTAPLGVLRELLRGALGVNQDAEPDLARERISERLVALDPSLVDALPLAHDLLAVSDPSSAEPAGGPLAQERAVAGLLRRLLRARGAAGAFVVHLDDAHWIDPQSVPPDELSCRPRRPRHGAVVTRGTRGRSRGQRQARAPNRGRHRQALLRAYPTIHRRSPHRRGRQVARDARACGIHPRRN